MSTFQPRDPGFEARVHASFAAQAMMRTLGVTLGRVAPGEVELSMPADSRFTQQHGFLHGGAIAAGLDTACGFAALSLMPEDAGVLTVEFKVNLLAPGRGERFRFTGRVVKPGRTLVFCEAVAHGLTTEGEERLIATTTATMMAITGRDDVKG
ncbi:MAG TPA: PaaI family thioesterase [Paracoccaceae bacterium]|nr:PaaI family thioesterase [Paracoccaceae bacterium]